MKHDLTDITLVVDRSGSMESIRADAQGGVNTLIEEQAKQEGEAFLTLVEFDQHYEFVHQGTPIQEVKPYELVPRGMTALLDAVGRAINETGQRLAAMPESQRPGLVVFIIVTDGQENSSREFSLAQIKEMIQKQQSEYNWQFTFLGANQDAFAEAGGMGIDADGVANYAMHKASAAFRGSSRKLSRMRAQAARQETVDNNFTEEEREEMQ